MNTGITVPEVFPDKYFRIAEIVKQKYKLTPKYFKSRKEVVDKYGSKIFNLLNVSYQGSLWFY